MNKKTGAVSKISKYGFYIISHFLRQLAFL